MCYAGALCERACFRLRFNTYHKLIWFIIQNEMNNIVKPVTDIAVPDCFTIKYKISVSYGETVNC